MIQTPKSSVRRWSLLELFPTGWKGSGNRCLAEVETTTLEDAIRQLQPSSPHPLDDIGYAKAGNLSYCVAEHYSPTGY